MLTVLSLLQWPRLIHIRGQHGKNVLRLLERIIDQYKSRIGDVAAAVSEEMGAPTGLATTAQAPAALGHFMTTLNVLREFKFEENIGSARVIHEPAGVCGLITPWNWPINPIACKVAPALAAGCTMVLKPSEVAPFNAVLFAEILDAAGVVPAGVFNLVNGDGPTVGALHLLRIRIPMWFHLLVLLGRALRSLEMRHPRLSE